MEALLGLAAAHYLIALDDPASHSPARSWQLYGAAYQLASELGDKAGMVRALLPLPQLADCGQGSHQEVHDRVQEALSLSQQIDDDELILDCKLALGIGGDELLAQLEARHDLHRLNRAYWHLLMEHLWARDYQQAVRCCDTAIRLAREIGVPPVMYPSHQAMALVCLGRYGEVWSALQEEVADEAHRLGAGMKDLATGEFLIELRAYEQAAEVAGRAIEQGRLLSRSWMSRWGQLLLVTALLRSGKLDAATLAGICGELDAGGWPLPAELMAEVCLADGRTDEALRHAEEAIATRRKDGHRFELVIATEMKLRALTQLGRAAEALTPTEEALAMAEEQGYLPLVWRLREAKALALTALGETDAAEYEAAAAVLGTLAERIEDVGLRQQFLSNPQIASALAAGRGPETPGSEP